MPKTSRQPCPCGNPSYAECCQPYLEGNAMAPDAVSLMRSRYTAYVLEEEEYLRSTWAEENRPSGTIIEKNQPTKWIGLKILRHQEHEDRATVEFIASYKVGGRMQKLHEVSRFVRENSQWFYFDGTFF